MLEIFTGESELLSYLIQYEGLHVGPVEEKRVDAYDQELVHITVSLGN